jgi:hypothetical protein
MRIADARAVPLGIPVALVRDLLERGVASAAILESEGSLLDEYRDARGYAYAWGNIIEARSAGALAWHFVPVELWQQTEQVRWASVHSAVELIPGLQPTVVANLRHHLPDDLVLIGCHPQSRRYAHVLFGLLLVEPVRERRARRWLGTIFLPRVLPAVLEVCRARIADICRRVNASESSSHHVV